jgi:exodeoxyribonuclease III
MRLVIWNCNMAFHRKYPFLLALKPDLAIIPESASPEFLKSKAPEFKPATQIWIGDNPNKGLSIFSFGEYHAELASIYDPMFPYIAPIKVAGDFAFNLIGVWACHAKPTSYVDKLGPLRRSLRAYHNFILSAACIVAGDFNDNVQWDKPRRANKHSLNVELLEELGLSSAYHSYHSESQGSETRPTIFWRNRSEAGPQYHIDYCFIPEGWTGQVSVQLGKFSDWVAAGLSDHVPLIVDITVT